MPEGEPENHCFVVIVLGRCQGSTKKSKMSYSTETFWKNTTGFLSRSRKIKKTAREVLEPD
jgi:hypothetical protein